MIEVFLSEIVAVEHSFPMRDVGVSVSVTWKMRYSTNGTTGAILLDFLWPLQYSLVDFR